MKKKKKKREIQALFHVQRIICDFGEDRPAQPMFPGCFQPHQVLSRKAPGAQYFAGTGCIYLPMCGFRDRLHWKILVLTLGYIDVICICVHTVSIYIFICTHLCYLCTYNMYGSFELQASDSG